MKKAILVAVLAILFCVFCACVNGGDDPADPTPQATVGATVPQETEPERTRVPVIQSTLPAIGEITEAPEVTEAPLDTEVFKPETFTPGEGDLDIVTDAPGYGEINP